MRMSYEHWQALVERLRLEYPVAVDALEQAAEAAAAAEVRWAESGTSESWRAWHEARERFHARAAPVVVLELIAEVERLRESVGQVLSEVGCDCCDCDCGAVADVHDPGCSPVTCLACRVEDALAAPEEVAHG